DIGEWGSTMSWPLVAVNMTLLRTGEVLMWDVWEYLQTPSARLWNPTTQTFTSVPNLLVPLFCAGQAALPAGRLIAVGGHNGDDIGNKTVSIFDPTTRVWTRLADLNVARWYPTVLTLADGRVIALGGEITPGVLATQPEIYDPATNQWTLFTVGKGSTPQELGVNEEEYPASFLLPDGHLFTVAGTDLRSRLLDVPSQSWTLLPGQAPVPSGTSIQYRPGKILSSGGGTGNANPVRRDAAVIDLNQPNP